MTASVGASVAPGTVTNTAVVSGGGDPNTGNNTATDPTVITSPAAGPDLTLTKAQTGGVVMAGQLITFTLRVTNVGTGADERHRHRDGGAAAGPDHYCALWLRLDLHRRNADVPSR